MKSTTLWYLQLFGDRCRYQTKSSQGKDNKVLYSCSVEASSLHEEIKKRIPEIWAKTRGLFDLCNSSFGLKVSFQILCNLRVLIRVGTSIVGVFD